jgi:DNA-binding NtrC family response regulator
VRGVERQKIVLALAATKGNKMQAAEQLGVSYKTLLTKIKDYELGGQ